MRIRYFQATSQYLKSVIDESCGGCYLGTKLVTQDMIKKSNKFLVFSFVPKIRIG